MITLSVIINDAADPRVVIYLEPVPKVAIFETERGASQHFEPVGEVIHNFPEEKSLIAFFEDTSSRAD